MNTIISPQWPHHHSSNSHPPPSMKRFSLNPFSRRSASSAQGNANNGALSHDSSNALSRALSKSSTRKSQQPEEQRSARSPMLNPSPATRRPRAQSPPPAYSPTADSPSGSSSGASPVYERSQSGAHPAISVQQASTEEDPYAFLSSFDTVFLVDDSGSMAGRSWRETQQALSALLPIIFSHDADGPDIYFMNHKSKDSGDSAEPWKAGTGYRNVTRSQGTSPAGEQLTVEEMFRTVHPRMGTPTGTRLNFIIRRYIRHYEQKFRETGDDTCLKPLNIIVITDGVPSDDVESVVIQAAKKLDALDAPPYQIGIQFFQVGNESGAADALRRLDDDLSDQVAGGVRDIVDTVSFDVGADGNTPALTGDGIMKAVLGSVVKRLDRKTSALRETSARGQGRA
ncbi:uncharacterized protein JN550_003063 [Neoarthrinium moseri]|uniref:uncharacterized protein n=1 Tax=Neoarthrinium moseri TaxID=1658444 RepID=UPI001FDE457D|nr:uncharacterized protein JN550_003063 [Neoarthrinium moseri]KAI1873794.1 hypothetical protein JN550_003063 [Neoarthrinium moseri]